VDNSFEICFQVFGYQKRCWWMLSSIVQQTKNNEQEIPRIIVKLNLFSKIDPYSEITSKMIKVFDPLIELKIREYDNKEEFEKRGLTRNKDIEECFASWIFFSDADMIFHPEFFSDMSNNYIKDWIGTGKLISGPRIDVSIPVANDLINSKKYESGVIDKSFETCWNNREGYSRGGHAPGAGYFQLVEVDYLRKNNITYCNPKRSGDRSYFDEKGADMRSDMKFRRNFSDKLIMRKNHGDKEDQDILKPIIHLNHYKKYNRHQWVKEWTSECK